MIALATGNFVVYMAVAGSESETLVVTFVNAEAFQSNIAQAIGVGSESLLVENVQSSEQYVCHVSKIKSMYQVGEMSALSSLDRAHAYQLEVRIIK